MAWEALAETMAWGRDAGTRAQPQAEPRSDRVDSAIRALERDVALLSEGLSENVSRLGREIARRSTGPEVPPLVVAEPRPSATAAASAVVVRGILRESVSASSVAAPSCVASRVRFNRADDEPAATALPPPPPESFGDRRATSPPTVDLSPRLSRITHEVLALQHNSETTHGVVDELQRSLRERC